jgi:hypothetical protein
LGHGGDLGGRAIVIVEPGGASGFQGMTESVRQLVAASKVGFTVSDAGGQMIVNAIDTLHAKITKRLYNARQLAQELPLGTSPAAVHFKPFLASIAGDPQQGLIAALTQLKKDLEDAHDAVAKSMVSYRQTEQGNASGMGSPGIWR